MSTCIHLRLCGVDLRERSSYALFEADTFTDVGVTGNGPLAYLSVYADTDRQAQQQALKVARAVRDLPGGVRVVGVYEELVTETQIGLRCGYTPATVRSWAAATTRHTTPAFPGPRDVLGDGTMTRLYAWNEVLAWARTNLHLRDEDDEDMTYLNESQVADLNVSLLHP